MSDSSFGNSFRWAEFATLFMNVTYDGRKNAVVPLIRKL